MKLCYSPNAILQGKDYTVIGAWKERGCGIRLTFLVEVPIVPGSGMRNDDV